MSHVHEDHSRLKEDDDITVCLVMFYWSSIPACGHQLGSLSVSLSVMCPLVLIDTSSGKGFNPLTLDWTFPCMNHGILENSVGNGLKEKSSS